MLIAPPDVSGCVTLPYSPSLRAEGMPLLNSLILNMSALVCRSVSTFGAEINRSDVIGVRRGVVVRIAVVVRIRGIRS